jgi:hypothetical protein
MQTLFQDIRYGVRLLLKAPGTSVVAVLTLAVVIGANSIVFCVAKSLMFPPLPFRDAGRILRLTEYHRETGGFASSIPDYLDWKAQNDVFSQMSAVSYGWSTISGGTEPEEVDTAFVSEDFFELLGVLPQAGRLFYPEEYRPGAERVMILANAFWQRQFGGRSDAIGRRLTLSDESYTIVGIMPPGFEDHFFTKAFLPLTARRDTIPSDRTNRRSGVFARLRPGVTLGHARREMEVISDRLAKAYPSSNRDVTVLVEPWRERIFGGYRIMTGLLLGAVVSAVDKQQPVFSVRTMEEKLSMEGSPRRTLAVMVGAFSLVALLLATVGTYGVIAYSVSERTPEIGIRTALGAQRRKTVAMVLKQGSRLLCVGLPLGWGGAFAVSRVLQSQLFGVSASDPITLAGVSLILAVVAISACYLPARRAAKVDPMVALRYE